MINQTNEDNNPLPMEDNNPEQEIIFSNTDFVEQEYCSTKDGLHLPMGIKVGRFIEMYRMTAERKLYGAITDFTEEVKKEIEDNEGYDKAPTVDFDGVSLVLLKKTNLMLLFTLFDTSVLYGHEKTNTGIVDENGRLPAPKGSINGGSVGSIVFNGVEYYEPVIDIQFLELAKKVFNNKKPNKKEKESLLKVLELMGRYQLNDDTLRSAKLISVTSDRIDGALMLRIKFHPLYALMTYNNYGTLPRDLMDRLSKKCKRLSPHTLDLISVINRMEVGAEFKRYERDLMEEIGLKECYEEHKGLAIKYLKKDFDVLVGIGMIYEPIISKRPEGTFYIAKKRSDFCTPEDEIIKPIESTTKRPTKRLKNNTKTKE